MTIPSSYIAVSGNTYPVKDAIKALGGRWDGDAKVWMVPPDKVDQARALVASVPVSVQPSCQTYRPSRCRDCGCAASRYNPIYRNGQCRQCWQSDKEERDMGY